MKKLLVKRLLEVSLTQMVVKIVNDELIHLLGSENNEINLSSKPPAIIMMVGLQGSGKTTSTAKMSYWIEKNKKKKVMMASLDIYRPAAQEQLISLAEKNNLTVLPIQQNKSPLEIAKLAQKEAIANESDVLILDSAGRNHIDKNDERGQGYLRKL